jgi:hypothetical protein
LGQLATGAAALGSRFPGLVGSLRLQRDGLQRNQLFGADRMGLDEPNPHNRNSRTMAATDTD